MRWTPRVDTSTQMGKAPKWRKCKNQDFFTGSQLYGAKRGRPQYSSLIPFPRCCLFASQVYLTQAPARVGRSGGVREYYGQKRGGKSGLIPFPRCSSPHYHPIPRIRDSSCSSSVTKKDTCYGVCPCYGVTRVMMLPCFMVLARVMVLTCVCPFPSLPCVWPFTWVTRPERPKGGKNEVKRPEMPPARSWAPEGP